MPTTHQTNVRVSVGWVMWLLFSMVMFALGYSIGSIDYWLPCYFEPPPTLAPPLFEPALHYTYILLCSIM